MTKKRATWLGVCAITLALARVGLAHAQDTTHVIDREVGVNSDPDHPESYLRILCLPQSLARDDSGRVRCEARAIDFDDLDAAEEVCSQHFESCVELNEDGAPYCQIKQLSNNQPLALQGPGFYYDDGSDALGQACRYAKQGIGFAPDRLLYSLHHFHIQLHCELP